MFSVLPVKRKGQLQGAGLAAPLLSHCSSFFKEAKLCYTAAGASSCQDLRRQRKNLLPRLKREDEPHGIRDSVFGLSCKYFCNFFFFAQPSAAKCNMQGTANSALHACTPRTACSCLFIQITPGPRLLKTKQFYLKGMNTPLKFIQHLVIPIASYL